MNNKITVTVCNKQVFSKPTEIGTFQMLYNSKYMELTLEELAQKVTNGYCFHPGKFNMEYVSKTFKNDNFIDTNMYCIDLDDNNYSVEDIKKITRDTKCCIIYNTFSSTEENRRYRVIYIGNRKTNREETERVVMFLIKTFSNFQKKEIPDTSCKSANHLYISGKELQYCVDNVIDVDNILNIFKAEDKEKFELEIRNLRREIKGLKPITNIKKHSNITIKKEKSNVVKISSSMWEDILIERLNNYKFVTKPTEINLEESFNFINNLDMGYLIGQNVGQAFNCILHADTNPSAFILKVEDKDRYKCFGCLDKTLSVLNLISLLICKNIQKTRDFVFNNLNIELESNYKKNSIKTLNNNIRNINRNKENKLYKTLKNRNLLGYYNLINNYAISFLPLTNILSTKTEEITFIGGVRGLASYFTENGLKGADFRNVNVKLNTLCKLGLLKKIEFTELNLELQKNIDLYANKNGFVNKTTCWIIPKLNKTVVNNAIELLKEDKENGVKAKGFSKKQIELLQGKDNANNIFKAKTKTEIDYNVFTEISNVVAEEIANKGYFTDKEIITILNKRGNKNVEYKVLTYMPSIIKAEGLIKTRISKELRSMYNIPENLKAQNSIYSKKK